MMVIRKQIFKKVLIFAVSLVLVMGSIPLAFADTSTGGSLEKDTIQGTPTDQADAPDEQSVEVADGGTSDQSATSEITDEQIAQVIIDEQDDVSAQSFSLESDALADRDSNPMQEFSGINRYDTAAQQAMYGWASSRVAILAGGEGWPDALAASGLAGALDCPVLLTDAAGLSAETANALSTLGVSFVIIVGGDPSVSPQVVTDLSGMSIETKRLSGSTRYDTQLAIYQYGIDGDVEQGIPAGLWDGSVVAVASGTSFADALSFSPVAFSAKIPVFLTNGDGVFSDAQNRALIKGAQEQQLFKSSLLLGSVERITKETEGFLWFVSQLASGDSKASERLGGSTRYETSVMIANWAVERGHLGWDSAAFTSGEKPYDALGGGALQGKQKSVLLLAHDAKSNPGVDALVASGETINSVKLFGDSSSVSDQVRSEIAQKLGFMNVTYTNYAISAERLLDLEWDSRPAAATYSYEEMRATINPATILTARGGMYQFARLDGGYTGLVTAEQLDAFIDEMVVYQEASHGVTSKLRGAGAYFIAAAKTYGINEVYLLTHAALESAWGCSNLAQGIVGGYEGYLNFYGIGAYDLDPNNGGAALAKKQGWTTPEKAIMGAASWIRANYVMSVDSSTAVVGSQNTLYKMKWDIGGAIASGSPWHQYATGITWHGGIARLMNQCYSEFGITPYNIGLHFDIPQYQ